MELNTEIVTEPPRAAATVIMLRDGAQGMEVFLLKRNTASKVLGGAYVFPGGKLDAADHEAHAAGQLDQSTEALRHSLNEPETDGPTAAALYVAALREAFEESGVLFAQDAGGAAVDIARASAMAADGQSFGTLLAGLGLRLQTRQLQPWSRWITPRQPSASNKRFDTRFFVAAVPAHQTASHDNHEATASVWVSPMAALHQYWARDIELAPPQIMSLAHLAQHTSVASALQEARQRPPPLILPESFTDEQGMRIICYPGDPQHTVRERALPGTSRLCYRDKRFEPLNGFESLFAN